MTYGTKEKHFQCVELINDSRCSKISQIVILTMHFVTKRKMCTVIGLDWNCAENKFECHWRWRTEVESDTYDSTCWGEMHSSQVSLLVFQWSISHWRECMLSRVPATLQMADKGWTLVCMGECNLPIQRRNREAKKGYINGRQQINRNWNKMKWTVKVNDGWLIKKATLRKQHIHDDICYSSGISSEDDIHMFYLLPESTGWRASSLAVCIFIISSISSTWGQTQPCDS